MNLFHEFYVQPMIRVYFETLAMYCIWLGVMQLTHGRTRRVISGIGVCLSVILIIIFTLYGRKIGGKTEISLIPFITFINARTLPELYRTMFMNMLLFMPFGLSLPFMLPGKINNKPVITIICGFVLSSVIEAVQFFCKIGCCETDDVIMNTLGVTIGVTSYIIVSLVETRRQRND